MSKWAVLYIGAGADTWAQAEAIGVQRSNYVPTKRNRAATQATYMGLSKATASFAGGGSGEDAAAIVAAATEGK